MLVIIPFLLGGSGGLFSRFMMMITRVFMWLIGLFELGVQ